MNPRGRIARLSLTTAEPARIADFYCGALGFERVASYDCKGEPFSELMGIGDAQARVAVLRLGREEVALLAFAEPGRSYLPPSASNDPWFQHMAVVVSDMEAAYGRLLGRGDWSPISRNGPERLPAASGSVTAFKFRDGEGHPLELLAFPEGVAPPEWRRSDAVFLGVDHSAIVVADTVRSLGFYERLLGFEVHARSLNRGPEQESLDGLSGAVVEVTGLRLPGAPHPNLELLRYRTSIGARLSEQLSSNDIAATRLEVEVEDLADAVAALRASGVAFVSPVAVRLGGKLWAALVRDPDGHQVLLRSAM